MITSVKGFILRFIPFLPAFLAKPLPAFAQEVVSVCPKGEFNPLCAIAEGDFADLVSTVITIILVLAVVIAVLYLLYGAVRWILSRGDKAEVENARNHIIAAVVGLIIAFLAFFIIRIIGTFFGLDILNLELPQFGR